MYLSHGSSQGFQTCVSVSVIGDLVRESDEIFSVEITPQNGNDEVTTMSFRVTILGDGDINSECNTNQMHVTSIIKSLGMG